MNLVTLLSVTFLAFQVVILAICIWLGYRCGTGRSVVRLIYLSLLAVLSFFLAKWISGSLSEFGLSVAARFYTEPIKQLLLKSPQTEQLLGEIIAAMLAPVFFALIFAVFQLLSLIKLKVISEKLTRLVKKDGDPMNPASRWIGAGLGAVQGLLIAAVLLAPISCAVVILRSVDPEALEALGMPGYEIRQTDTAGVYYSKDSISRGRADITAVHKKLSASGFSFAGFFADLLTEALTTIKGYDTSLTDEVSVILNAAGEALKVYNENIGSGISTELAAVNALSALLPYMEQSVLLPEISSQLLNAAADSWENDEAFLGMKLPDKDSGPASKIVGAVMQSFKNATSENVGGILNTLVGKNEGTASVMENILSLTGNDVEATSDESIELMANSLIVIGNNDDMAPVIEAVGQIGSDLIKEYGITTIPAEETGAYDEMKRALEEELNSTKGLDYESRVTSLANKIVSTAESYNYSLSIAKGKLAAIGLLSYFESVEVITVEGVMEYFGITGVEVSTNK
ncbi:MAG: hypothetical protein ACOYIA_00100 [Eubacteriales bacterium]|jgi:hypothetical protein